MLSGMHPKPCMASLVSENAGNSWTEQTRAEEPKSDMFSSSAERRRKYKPRSDAVSCLRGNFDNIYTLEKS